MRPLWFGITAGAAAASAFCTTFPRCFANAWTQDNIPSEVPLPVDKLACQLQRGGRPYKPVVLVSCGSFNPPTNMHLRMFELAKNYLSKEGFNVLGGYLSPVNDAYNKPALAPAGHRIAMAQAAVESSPFIMVDPWEAGQPNYQRSLVVLQRIEASLHDAFAEHEQDGSEGSQQGVRAMLLCGSDLVESFMEPGVWKPQHLRVILGEHGVVCVARNASSLESLERRGGSLLREFDGRLIFVEEPVENNTSSSLLRQLLAEDKSVKYLTPDPVVEYIKEHRLYGT